MGHTSSAHGVQATLSNTVLVLFKWSVPVLRLLGTYLMLRVRLDS